MKSIADRQKLFQDYISHYESRSHEGNVTLCDHKLECWGYTQLSDYPAVLGEFYSQLIRQNLQSKKEEHRVQALKQMMKGFAILELICVNLFLFPWRKEIRTLKVGKQQGAAWGRCTMGNSKLFTNYKPWELIIFIRARNLLHTSLAVVRDLWFASCCETTTPSMP